MTKSILSWTLPLYLALCIMLGGASADGYLLNALLQVLAIGFLAAALLSKPEPAATRAEHNLRLVIVAGMLVIALQFVPVPRGVWQALPGREALLAPFDAAGIPFPAGFVSVIPHESIKSAVWLLPPMAMLAGMTQMRTLYSPRQIAIGLIAMMCLAVVLGASQRASGGQSPLYFYHFTNRGSAVGFFANANHMASLLLTTIPFQAALAKRAFDRQRSERLAPLMMILASFAVTVAGVIVVGSMAGYALLVPVLAASALVVWGGKRAGIAALLLLVILAGMAAILSTSGGLALLDKASGMSVGSRQTIFGTTWEAIREFWPVGSGLGTFAEAYPVYENPLTVTRTFINHAHNDYLELLLETGLPGALAIMTFLVWWAVQAVRIWKRASTSPFAKAAVIATATLLVHSLVDYPLRAAGLATVFAACLALMAAPTASGAGRASRERPVGDDATD